ncbi:hypothetical protein Droror1_Dr00023973 [Drosera rotundifolia]
MTYAPSEELPKDRPSSIAAKVTRFGLPMSNNESGNSGVMSSSWDVIKTSSFFWTKWMDPWDYSYIPPSFHFGLRPHGFGGIALSTEGTIGIGQDMCIHCVYSVILGWKWLLGCDLFLFLMSLGSHYSPAIFPLCMSLLRAS